MKKFLFTLLATTFMLTLFAQKGQVVLSTDFDEAFPPAGWTIDAHAGNWVKSETVKAGGMTPECKFKWNSQFNGDSHLISPEIDLTGKTSVFLSFKHQIDNYDNGYTVGVATRSGGGAWTTVWSRTPQNITEDVLVNITNSDVGNSDFQFCMFFSGNSYSINYWYIDDIMIEIPADNDAKLNSVDLPKYSRVDNKDIKGQILNAGLTDITSVDISYQIDMEPVVMEQLTGLDIGAGLAYDYAFTTQWAATSGTHDLKVWLSNINGNGNDDDLTNDTISMKQYIATQETANFPLFEEFTSSTCAPCATFNTNVFTPFLAANGTECNVIKYQMNWPGSGDIYYTEEGGVRRVYYGVSGVPNLFTGGNSTSSTSTAVNAAFDSEKAKITFFEIASTHQITGDMLAVQVDITPYLTTVDNDFKVFIVAVEKKTTGNVGTNGETEFHNVMMKMLPDANGTEVNFTDDVHYIINETVDMSTTHVEEMSDLDVIVFIQNKNTKEIFQSFKSIEGTVGVSKISKKVASIYPNPVKNTMTIENAENANIEIYDIVGKLVISKANIISNQNIDVSELNEGTYFVKIYVNKKVETQKFVISR